MPKRGSRRPRSRTRKAGFRVFRLVGPQRGSSYAPAALAVDVGEVSSPIRTWDDIARLMPEGAVTRTLRRLDSGRSQLLIVRYWRQSQSAALALRIYPGTGGTPAIRRMEAASSSRQTRSLRAEGTFDRLQATHVGVVGIGAVGSFTADLLARSGVGRLTLIDAERLRPGNIVRHLASDEAVGQLKVDAVKNRILGVGLHASSDIEVSTESLQTPEEAETLLDRCDVILDATANASASNLLAFVAETNQRPLVSCALMRGGALVRIDRWPLADGEHHLPPVAGASEEGWSREGGCGDPVSPSTPTSVIQAATLASTCVVDHLTDRTLPPSILFVVIAQPDPPYDSLGFVT